MKKVALISLAVVLSGCAATHEDDLKGIAEHAEKATMNKVAFCGSHELTSYFESEYYYNWTCSNGFSGMLKKES